MDLIKKLQTGAAALTDRRAQGAELARLGDELKRDEISAIEAVAELDPKIVLQSSPDTKGLPSQAVSKIEHLRAVQDKLRLLPGAIANNDRKAAALKAELEAGYRELRLQYRETAKHRQADMLLATIGSLMPTCGNDPARASKAAQSVVEHSEAARWIGLFSVNQIEQDIVMRIERLVGHIERFEAGEPVQTLAKPVKR